jgi:threonine/homoserine/homoserine lactone efflux protein
MSLHGIALFCLVYLVATATPGPGIAAIIARVLAKGPANIWAYIAGFVLADLLWFTLAATGMAVLAQSAHTLFLVVKYVGAAYLMYIAYRMWTDPALPVAENSDPAPTSVLRLLLAGITLTLGNPKVMIFFLALLPTVVDLGAVGVREYFQIAAAMCVILTSVLSAYALAALRTRRLFRNPRALRWLNRGTGTVMAGAAVTVATR